MTAEQAIQFPITVHFTFRDMPRAIEFYKEKLGFQIKECWPDAENPMFASMILDRQAILLGGYTPADQADKWCGDDAQAKQQFETMVHEYDSSTPGVGIMVYLKVDDVDAFHATLVDRGVEGVTNPKTQFYGQRDFMLRDPEGYRLAFYAPVTMESCQSCGMPLAEGKPGQMYCDYCSDEQGNLKSYEEILEGTIQGYFMGMQKMERAPAEEAAKEHLAKMPAWVSRA